MHDLRDLHDPHTLTRLETELARARGPRRTSIVLVRALVALRAALADRAEHADPDIGGDCLCGVARRVDAALTLARRLCPLPAGGAIPAPARGREPAPVPVGALVRLAAAAGRAAGRLARDPAGVPAPGTPRETGPEAAVRAALAEADRATAEAAGRLLRQCCVVLRAARERSTWPSAAADDPWLLLGPSTAGEPCPDHPDGLAAGAGCPPVALATVLPFPRAAGAGGHGRHA